MPAPGQSGFENGRLVPIEDFSFDEFDSELRSGNLNGSELTHDLGWYKDDPLRETEEGKELARRAEALVHFLSDLAEWGVKGTVSGASLRWQVLYWLFHPEARFTSQREFALSIGMTKQNLGRAISDFRSRFHIFDERFYSDGARKAARKREAIKRKNRLGQNAAQKIAKRDAVPRRRTSLAKKVI